MNLHLFEQFCEAFGNPGCRQECCWALEVAFGVLPCPRFWIANRGGWIVGWVFHHAGAAPLIIANGGTSGLYPDQTAFAYQDALNTSSQPLALLCDLQLTKDNLGICRTGLNLTTSTFSYKYNVSSTYVVNGVPTHGYFSVDYMQADLLNPNFTTGMSQSPFALSFSCYKWVQSRLLFSKQTVPGSSMTNLSIQEILHQENHYKTTAKDPSVPGPIWRDVLIETCEANQLSTNLSAVTVIG